MWGACVRSCRNAVCVAWLIHVWDNDSLVRDIVHFYAYEVRVCVLAEALCVWHDSFTHGTWLARSWHSPFLYVSGACAHFGAGALYSWQNSFTCGTWLARGWHSPDESCNVRTSHVPYVTYEQIMSHSPFYVMGHDSFIRDMTCLYACETRVHVLYIYI